MWAWKAFTDPNPDFSLISHCSMFNVNPFLPMFKLPISPEPGSSSVPFWWEAMRYSSALALCRLLYPPNLSVHLGNIIPWQ